MSTNVQSELRQGLEAELRGAEGQRLLKEVVEEVSLPATVENWSGLAELLRGIGSEHPTHDHVLAACFARRDASPERVRVIETALLALSWPMLEYVHSRKQKLDADPETRWSDVLFVFLRVIRRFNLERRNERISGKIYNDVAHDLYQTCSKRLAITEREIVHDPEEMNRMAGREEPGADESSPDRRDIIVEFLDRYRRMGVIDDIERNLLAAVLADGMCLKKAAAQAGISYEAAKKRKQRAETAITNAAPASR